MLVKKVDKLENIKEDLENNFFQMMDVLLEEDNNVADICVATSGGSDSMALTLLAKKWSIDNNVKLTSIIIDHKLRSNSTLEAKKVSNWLNVQNIHNKILSWEGDKPNSNVQSIARENRYRLLTNFCKNNDIKYLLVGHNIEDQAETLLMNLMRGSGIDGLSSMDSKKFQDGIFILRPLLKINKEHIKSYLSNINQEWIEDPSNKNEDFLRVKIRNFMQEIVDKDLLVKRLSDSTEKLNITKSYINEQLSLSYVNIVDFYQEGYCKILLDDFIELHSEIKYRLIGKILNKISGAYYKARYEKLKNLITNLDKSQANVTLHGCKIIIKDGYIFFIREFSAIQEDIAFDDVTMVWDNRFICSKQDISDPNLKLGALGVEGYKQICAENPQYKKINLLKDVIYSLPCLKEGEEVLACSYLKYAICDDYKQFTSKYF